MNTVRMPGSDVLHLVPAALEVDARFGKDAGSVHFVGEAVTLCEKRGSEWIADSRGEPCEKCLRAQDVAVAKRVPVPEPVVAHAADSRLRASL